MLYWFEPRDRESATRVARRSGLLVYNGTGTVDPRLQWNDLTLTPQIEVSLLGQNHSARHNLARFPNSPSSDWPNDGQRQSTLFHSMAWSAWKCIFSPCFQMAPLLIEFSLFFSENLGCYRRRIYLGPFKAIQTLKRANHEWGPKSASSLLNLPLQENVPNMQHIPLYLGSMKSNSFPS